MTIDEKYEDGYPGISAGYDNNTMSLHRLYDIVKLVNSGDTQWLEESSSKYARTAHASEIDAGIVELFALFPGGDVIRQEDQQAASVVHEKTDSSGKTLLLLSTCRVTAGGVEYWLFCADFRENATDPDSVGVNANGVAPWTASGDSAAESGLFSWADSFDVNTITPQKSSSLTNRFPGQEANSSGPVICLVPSIAEAPVARG